MVLYSPKGWGVTVILPIFLIRGVKKPKSDYNRALFYTLVVYFNGVFKLKRYAEQTLKQWLTGSFRKPLVVRGARQVGKSTLVRNFAKEHQLNLIEVNLERHVELDLTFKTLSMPKILSELEGLTGQHPLRENSLLFLDEIQATPWALQALRYFYEDHPELPVIAAGSLLEIVLSKHSFSMPVGRIEYLHLGPMSFEEYLQARDKRLLDYLVDYDLHSPIPTTVHHQLLEKQREYLFVGGMPEAIARFIQTNEFMEAVKVQQSIIETYRDDFSKYCKADQLIRLHRVFNYVPSSVGNKTKYCHISREDGARELKNAISLLAKSGVITPVYHSSCSGIPLHAQANEHKYKLLFLDIGLVNRVCALDWLAINAMDERKLINEGPLAEQFIGQHLRLLSNPDASPTLSYWVREQRTSNAEVDYVISRGDMILPIEVKAGRSGSLKSLFQFAHEKKTQLAIRFDLNPPSFQTATHKTRIKNQECEIKVPLLSLPLYLVGQLPHIIDRYRETGFS